MGEVVFNTTDSPVPTPEGQVDGRGWKYLSDEAIEAVQDAIDRKRLLVVKVWAQGNTLEAAKEAVEQYRKNNKPAESAGKTRSKKVRDTEDAKSEAPSENESEA